MNSTLPTSMQADLRLNSSFATKKDLFLNQEAPQFIDSAKKIAKSILCNDSINNHSAYKNRDVVDVHHHHHYSYGYGYGFGYNPFWTTPVYVIDSRANDTDNALKALVGVIGTFVAGAAFYAMGATLRRCKETSAEMDKINSFKNQLRDYRHFSADSEQSSFDKLERLATLKARIFKREMSESVYNLSTAVALAVAGTMALIGALAASYAFITAGTLLGLGSGAVVLFNWGLNSTQQKQERDAKQILAIV